jgi:hypothetical protein
MSLSVPAPCRFKICSPPIGPAIVNVSPLPTETGPIEFVPVSDNVNVTPSDPVITPVNVVIPDEVIAAFPIIEKGFELVTLSVVLSVVALDKVTTPEPILSAEEMDKVPEVSVVPPL